MIEWGVLLNAWRYLSSFISYLIGFTSGCVFVSFVYCLFSLHNVKKGLAQNKPKKNDVNQKEILELIEIKKRDFKTKAKKDKDNFGNLLVESVKDLTLEIVTHLYPDSKYPYFELTIDESLILILYIHQRIDDIFKNKVLRIFRKMTLRRIFIIREAIIKKNMLQKFKKTKKITNTVGNIKNFLNPFHWIKKFVFDKPLEFIFIQIGVSLISIIGEEFYKVYSKKIFESQTDIEQDLQEVLESISKFKNN